MMSAAVCYNVALPCGELHFMFCYSDQNKEDKINKGDQQNIS